MHQPYGFAKEHSAKPLGQKLVQKVSENLWVDMFGKVPFPEKKRWDMYEYIDLRQKSKIFGYFPPNGKINPTFLDK
jgi:hypothetical protein